MGHLIIFINPNRPGPPQSHPLFLATFFFVFLLLCSHFKTSSTYLVMKLLPSLLFHTPHALSPPIMAPLLLREIKGMTFSCSSPASLATCSTIHHKSTIQPFTRREIDRHTHHLRDPQRTHFDRSNPSSRPRTRLDSDSKAARRKSSADADSSHYLLQSSRFRLDDSYYDIFTQNPVQIPSFLAIEKPRSEHIGGNEGAVLRPSSSTRTQDQVLTSRIYILFGCFFL